ncbi:hypothetical protein HMPREF9371_1186 [Neisseria shayeganii 871]|uniref:Uncharacterized protein n=1 Tax=Neisseria shayeganii 871 TaxID=1032488 RepID=G4CHU7_9NEIS|nr:hypothetical protein HMPREF9371_1186 [Neisseria shayeganii 871]
MQRSQADYSLSGFYFCRLFKRETAVKAENKQNIFLENRNLGKSFIKIVRIVFALRLKGKAKRRRSAAFPISKLQKKG